MVSKLKALCRFCLLLWIAGPGAAQAQNGQPAIVDVRPISRQVAVGQDARFEIRLLDASRRAVATPRPLTFEVEATAPSGRTSRIRVTIPAGASSAAGTFKVSEQGPISVRTSQPELPQGGTVIFGSGLQVRGIEREAEALSPSPDTDPASVGAGGADAPGGLTIASDAPVPDAAIVISKSLDRRIRAGGNEGIEIFAFLENIDLEQAPRVDVQMLVTQGYLEPNPIVIPAGKGFGQATLTSDRPGQIELRVLGSNPSLPIKGEPGLKVDFGAPIWGVSLEAKPKEITIVGQSVFEAQLLDSAGTSVPTDQELRMSLSFKQGDGSVSPADLVFPVGESSARATYRPINAGSATISGTMTGFITQEAKVDASLPWLSLILAVLGGSLGGLVAFLTAKERWWRIPIGTVTGFIIYWVAIFGFIEQIPAAVAQNVLTALILPAIGGYLGTGVITSIGKLVGVRT